MRKPLRICHFLSMHADTAHFSYLGRGARERGDTCYFVTTVDASAPSWMNEGEANRYLALGCRSRAAYPRAIVLLARFLRKNSIDILQTHLYDAAVLGVLAGRGIQRSVGGERIRFPAKFSRYYESDYEPETFRFLRAQLKPGDVFLDIGAHIGLFTVVASRLVSPGGKVFSFEPTPFTREVLTEVVRLNGCEDVAEVRGEAVSERSGTMTFHDTGDEASNANSLVNIERGTSGIEVPVISIDDLVADRKIRPACLKIDAEGAELDVLRGGRRTIEEFRPVIRLGLHPPQIKMNGQELQEIWALIGDFRLEPVFEGRPVEKAWFCDQEDLFDIDLLPA